MSSQTRLPPGTHQAPPDVLVSAWLPLANEALAAGHAARVASKTAQRLAARFRHMDSRPLPEAARERRWAEQARERHRAEAEGASSDADQLMERFWRLMERLGGVSPHLADVVDAAIWAAGTFHSDRGAIHA
jgi:hypothetical protein